VLLYFDQTLRERAYRLFDDSLSNFGLLVLGKQESLRFTSYAERFRELRDGLRVYRRVW
jgi:chemotaxis protein methyltransferase CheR